MLGLPMYSALYTQKRLISYYQNFFGVAGRRKNILRQG